MFTLIKSVSRFENHIDASIEKFIFHHKFLGVFNDLHWNASCYLGSSLCMYNHYYFANCFPAWLDMRWVCGSRKC